LQHYQLHAKSGEKLYTEWQTKLEDNDNGQ